MEALSDPTLSLLAIARLYNTSLDALTAWMGRPDIRDQLRAIHTAVIRRNQLVAATRMTKVILACEEIIDGYLDEEHNNPIERTDARAIEQRRRARETARKAASLIARISRCSTPPLRGRGHGGGSDSRTTTLAPAHRAATGSEIDRSDSRTTTQTPINQDAAAHPDALDTHLSVRASSLSEGAFVPAPLRAGSVSEGHSSKLADQNPMRQHESAAAPTLPRPQPPGWGSEDPPDSS